MEKELYNEFMKNLEKKLNERDQKIKSKEELIKDIKDFEELLPELEQVIRELETKYDETKTEEIKKELNSYLKEREVYFDTIQTFRNNLTSLNESLEQEEKLISDLYKRREIEFDLKSFEQVSPFEPVVNVRNQNGEITRIPNGSENAYQMRLADFEEINDMIVAEFVDYEMYDVEEEESKDVEVASAFEIEKAKEKSELEEKRKELLKNLTEIEQEKGKKRTLEYTYRNEKRRVSIPKRLAGKYNYLLSQLKSVEKALEEYLPTVKFEQELYETMTEEQKKSYIANLMLQMEARAQTTLNKTYVQGKYIPTEYKKVYEDLIHLLKRDPKYLKSYSYPIDWPSVSTMTVEERKNYFEDLMNKYIEAGKENGIALEYENNTYILKENDIVAFKICYEEYQKSLKELQEQEDFKINLDEEFLSNLSEEELKAYYVNAMESITKKKCIDKMSYTVGGVTYTFDKKYQSLFIDIASRYDRLTNKNKKFEILKGKIKPLNINKIKDQIKKHAVKIMLGVATIAALGAAYVNNKNNKEALEEQKIESVTNNLAKGLMSKINIPEEAVTTEFNQELKEMLTETREEIQHLKKEEPSINWSNISDFTVGQENGLSNVLLGDEEKAVKLKYPNDEYRIVTRTYEMPNNEVRKVNMESEEAMSLINEIESLGGALKSVDAVARSGEEDYAINRIPTATFTINDQLNPTEMGRGR